MKELHQNLEVPKLRENNEMSNNDENWDEKIDVSPSCQNYKEFQEFDEKLATNEKKIFEKNCTYKLLNYFH